MCINQLKIDWKNLKEEYNKESRKDWFEPFKFVNFIWRKKYKTLFFLLFIIGVFIIVYFLIINVLNKGEAAISIIYFFTAVIILWYTRETADLKQISQKQLIETRKSLYIQLRPFIRLQWSNIGLYNPAGQDWHIKIINEGIGVAIDFKMTFSHTDNTDYRSIIASEKAVKSVTETNYKDLGFNDYNEYFNKFSPDQNSFNIFLEYRDLNNHLYMQTFITDPTVNDKFRLIGWTLPEIFEDLGIKMIEMTLNESKKEKLRK